MAGYLPQMEMLDMSVPLQAYQAGNKMGQEDSQRNLLREVGQTAATQGYDAASKVALSRGDVGTGLKLSELSLDRQTKMYDFLGRAAIAADTPEKWQQYIGILSNQFGPERVKGFENFSSRESAILLSKNAFDTAQQQAASARFGRDIGGMVSGTPQPAPAQPQYGGAIASIESGGKYDLTGPVTPKTGDRAYGKYQVMGANVGPWTKEVLGQEMTPQQFLANPQAQDAVFNAKFGSYVQKYGPEGAAKAWFAGEGGMNNPNAKDVLGTTVAGYGEKFAKAIAQQPQQPPQPQQPDSAIDQKPPQGAMIGNASSRQMLPALLRAASDPNLPQGQKAVALEMLKSALDEAKLPNDVKEYMFAVSQGEKRTYTDWDINRKREASTKVTQNNKGEDAYDAERNKGRAKRAADFVDAGDKAFSTLGSIQLMRQATSDPRFYSGTLAEQFALPLKQAIVSLGGDPKGAASMEVFRSQANKSVLDSMGGSLGTGFSNADRDFVVSQAPGLQNTPTGNKALLAIMEKVERRKIEIAKLAQEYEGEKGRLDNGFDKIVTQYRERNPLFSPQEKADIQLATAAPADLEAEARRRGLVK
jgi:hypothetical protein